MVSYPGDLTPDQRALWFKNFEVAAQRRWGAERALAIEDKLRDVATAVGRLEAIEFTPTDHPAFYLSDIPYSPSPGLSDV